MSRAGESYPAPNRPVLKVVGKPQDESIDRAHFHAEHQGQLATFTFDGSLLAGSIQSGRDQAHPSMGTGAPSGIGCKLGRSPSRNAARGHSASIELGGLHGDTSDTRQG